MAHTLHTHKHTLIHTHPIHHTHIPYNLAYTHFTLEICFSSRVPSIHTDLRTERQPKERHFVPAVFIMPHETPIIEQRNVTPTRTTSTVSNTKLRA